MSTPLPLSPDSIQTLRTSRFDLEPLTRAHAEAMYPLLDDPRVYAMTGGLPPTSLLELSDAYTALESRRSPDGRELWFNWVIRERSLNAVVGFIQATVSPSQTLVAWLIGVRWQGRGYASESAAALVNWLDRHGVAPIRACVHAGHGASQAVARRAGFERTTKIRDGEEVWDYVPKNARAAN